MSSSSMVPSFFWLAACVELLAVAEAGDELPTAAGVGVVVGLDAMLVISVLSTIDESEDVAEAAASAAAWEDVSGRT